jgi:hypothetical protein
VVSEKELMSDSDLHFLPTSGEWQFRALCANSNATQHHAFWAQCRRMLTQRSTMPLRSETSL